MFNQRRGESLSLFFNMKSKEIIQQATDNLSDGVRENYVYGNIFLYDVIRTHITDLKSCMIKHDIFCLDNKRQYNNLEKSINTAFERIRKQMGEEAYNYSPVFLEKFEDEFGNKLKVLFYSIKREYDRLKQPKSDIITHLSMIYLLSGFEIARTTWYAGEVQKQSQFKMNAVYDQCIVSIRNISGQLIKRLPNKNDVNMNPKEIQMAFAAFERELNECKIEFCKIA